MTAPLYQRNCDGSRATFCSLHRSLTPFRELSIQLALLTYRKLAIHAKIFDSCLQRKNASTLVKTLPGPKPLNHRLNPCQDIAWPQTPKPCEGKGLNPKSEAFQTIHPKPYTAWIEAYNSWGLGFGFSLCSAWPRKENVPCVLS